VHVPKQRNRREENEKIKAGGIPAGWPKNKKRQKDTVARWTKKNGKSFYGYKNHMTVDVKHKLIRGYGVTDAAVHDSNVFEWLLKARGRLGRLGLSLQGEARCVGEGGLPGAYPAQGAPEPADDRLGAARQSDEVEDSIPSGACLRGSGAEGGQPDPAHDRDGHGQGEDRFEESGLQSRPVWVARPAR